jgi:hypothetical protein
VAAAIPSRIAISGVIGQVLAVPRTPSVPKNFRAVIVPHSNAPAKAKAG